MGRHHQGFGHVPTGLIQYHHRVHVGGKFLGELLEDGVHHVRVDLRRDQARGLAGFRAYGGKHIQVVILVLLDGPGTRADFGPHPRERAVLAEAGLILVVRDEALVGVGRLDLGQRLGEFFFLKASSTTGSVSGCVPRGMRSL
jgi:hypothetical protein